MKTLKGVGCKSLSSQRKVTAVKKGQQEESGYKDTREQNTDLWRSTIYVPVCAPGEKHRNRRDNKLLYNSTPGI